MIANACFSDDNSRTWRRQTNQNYLGTAFSTLARGDLGRRGLSLKSQGGIKEVMLAGRLWGKRAVHFALNGAQPCSRGHPVVYATQW